jgi:hypothetical protein
MKKAQVLSKLERSILMEEVTLDREITPTSHIFLP